MRAWVRYCILKRWLPAEFIESFDPLPAPATAKYWLRKPQLLAVDGLARRELDDYKYIVRTVLVKTGLRAHELVLLSTDDLLVADRLLQVRKGKGAKARRAPISPELILAWEAHVLAHRLAHGAPLLFRRTSHPLKGGAKGERYHQTDLRKACSQRQIGKLCEELLELAEDERRAGTTPSDQMVVPHICLAAPGRCTCTR